MAEKLIVLDLRKLGWRGALENFKLNRLMRVLWRKNLWFSFLIMYKYIRETVLSAVDLAIHGYFVKWAV